MAVVAWVILGLIFGFAGSKLIHRTDGRGIRTGSVILIDTMLGTVGAIVGGFIFSVSGSTRATDIDLWSLLAAVTGTVLVLFVKHAIIIGHHRRIT
jgi:uncharacterized membrane protein YeaQ/YmgE (transglycosylase-associated protein family)